jgi:hypothetical protein
MKLSFDSDRLLGLSAMVVSVGSLIIIAYQAALMRQAQRASVLPYLYISLSANDQQGIHLNLTNSGIGPAMIDDVKIHYKGREIPGDPYDFFIAERPEIAKLGLGVDKIQKGRLIPAGATIQMVEFGSPGTQKLLPDVLRLFEIAEVPRSWYANLGTAGGEKAVIEILFSSVYGERWRVRSDRIVPDRL